MQKLLAITLGALVLSACQSTPTAPVIQRNNATFETTGLGTTKALAQKHALDSAKKQCGMRSPIILSDQVHYNGVLDEKTGRLIDQGVAIVGTVLGTKTPSLSRDDDYEYRISFKCQ